MTVLQTLRHSKPSANESVEGQDAAGRPVVENGDGR